jgi:3-oxoacyl-[acyl-carrier protein] reductase
VQLTGRVALVTGAGSGIGRATALALAAHGVSGVGIGYLANEDGARSTADEVRRSGAQPMCVRADVRQDDQVRSMVNAIGERFGRLDILINNAAITHWVPVGDLEALTDEIWRDTLDVDVVAAFRCVRAASAHLKAARGVVINVASVSGVLAPSTLSSVAYGAAKAGLIHLTRSLAVALAPEVRVNAVAPAFTRTRWMEDHYLQDYPEREKQASAVIPLGRVAEPEDVAAAIIGLIIGSDFVTGQTLIVDGGLSLT